MMPDLNRLLRLDAKAMRGLLCELDNVTLVLALQDIGDELLERVLGVLSHNAKYLLLRDLNRAPGVTKSDVVWARNKLCRTLDELIAVGAVDMVASPLRDEADDLSSCAPDSRV